MTDPRQLTRFNGDIPRRVKLSSREIGVAVALTLAAVLQLFWSLSGKDGGKMSSAASQSELSRKAP